VSRLSQHPQLLPNPQQLLEIYITIRSSSNERVRTLKAVTGSSWADRLQQLETEGTVNDLIISWSNNQNVNESRRELRKPLTTTTTSRYQLFLIIAISNYSLDKRIDDCIFCLTGTNCCTCTSDIVLKNEQGLYWLHALLLLWLRKSGHVQIRRSPSLFLLFSCGSFLRFRPTYFVWAIIISAKFLLGLVGGITVHGPFVHLHIIHLHITHWGNVRVGHTL
jgi:hypothetical protein